MPKITVVLDPGHSWNYNAGCVAGYYESNAMYDLALYLKEELERYNIFNVVLTKTTAKANPSLEARGVLAIKEDARLFLSLHSNGISNGVAYGVVGYTSVKRNSTEFCNKILGELKTLFNNEGSVKTTNRGAKIKKNSSGTDYYGVLRNSVSSNSTIHSLLIEHGFHSTFSECTLLNQSSFLKKIAKIEAKCIYDEFSQYYISDTIKVYKGDTTDSLNVRSGPGTNHTVLGVLSKGTRVDIISIDGNWARINYCDSIGYVSKSYLTYSGSIPKYSSVKNPLPAITGEILPFEPPIKKEQICDATVNCDVLNVRSGPGTNYEVVGSLVKNASVMLYSDEYTTKKLNNTEKLQWYRVSLFNGVEGYVYGEYVTLPDIEHFEFAYVNCSTLNVRRGPGTDYGKIDTLSRNDQIVVFPDSEVNGWIRFLPFDPEHSNIILDIDWLKLSSIDSLWVSKRYLAFTNDNGLDDLKTTAENSGVFSIGFGIINCSTLNVRSGPGTNYSTIGTLKKGAAVVIINSDGDWDYIVYGDKKAYIYDNYYDTNTFSPIGRSVSYDISSASADVIDWVYRLPESKASEALSDILSGKLTSPYGMRVHPITGKYSMHNGIDIGANSGTPIYSPVDGIVMANAFDTGGFGNYICIVATDGTKHYFAHMKFLSELKIGSIVVAGQFIGYIGQTGSATGPHLHYEIRYTDNTTRIPPDNYQYIFTVNKQVPIRIDK